MIKWIAFIMAYSALVSGASQTEVANLKARLSAIENRKCILMAVNTPSGVTSICAEDQP